MRIGSYHLSPWLLSGIIVVISAGIGLWAVQARNQPVVTSDAQATSTSSSSPSPTPESTPTPEVTPTQPPATSSPTPKPTVTPTPKATTTSTPSNTLLWQQGDGGWKAMGTVPTCAATLSLGAPADLSKATAILYPGQTRGGNYKPHGGFRFDTSSNEDIDVTAPIDGFIVRGGRYLAEGEPQYTFDVMNNCGVMYRLGHFRTLPSNLQKLADTWPAPQENDSRTQTVSPPVYVKKGELLATSVGIVGDGNTFFDFGVYDYRSQNEASASASYQSAHTSDQELSWHAVCWFGWLSSSDEVTVRALPAGDPGSGKNSDYCK